MYRSFRLLQILAILVLTLGAASAGITTNAPGFFGPGKVRFFVQPQGANANMSQLASIARWLTHNHFDVAGINRARGYVEVITTPEGVRLLKQKGLHGHELQSESELHPDARYLNPLTLEARLKSIAQAFPKFTRLQQIGTSIQGRPIWALLVSDTPQANDPRALEKPTLLFDGLHHAREVMTTEVVTDVADTILRAAQTNEQARALLHRWNIWLVPMVNVDGSNIVFTKDAMWRKNGRGNQQSVFGVDINRNYPYRWNGCHGSGNAPNAQDYQGAAGQSEPETVAMVNLANHIRPTASLSYHSYSELVLTPYGCGGEYTGERQLVAKVAQELAQQLPSDSGRGFYTPGTPWELLYDVDGSSMDYLYAAFGALSYTLEINLEFQPTYNIREATLQKQRRGWGYFLNRIDQNLLHVVALDGKTAAPAQALIAIDTISAPHGELPFKTNQGGHYFKVLDPGHYVISAKLADGRTGQIQVDMKGRPQNVSLTVQ